MEPLNSTVDQMGQKSRLADTGMSILSGTIGKFTVAGLAVTGINKLVGAIGDMASRSTPMSPLEESFGKLTQSIGTGSDEMLQKLRTATRGMVTDFDLMQPANQAVLLGIPASADQIAKLSESAVILGKAMAATPRAPSTA